MTPRFQLLTQADIEKIHETSLNIMENVGVVFSYEPAREMLKKTWCQRRRPHHFLPQKAW